MARAAPPSPRYPGPAPATLSGLVVRAPGAPGRSWRPAFAKGMFLPAEVTRGAVITGKFPAIAPGIAAAGLPAAG